MRRDLDTLLDECIDRINEGKSLDECLASYPEQAEELEPRLRAMFDIRDTLSAMPGATAKAAMRQRLDAAQVSLEKSHRKPLWRPLSLFGRPRVFAPVAIALVLALICIGLYGPLTPGPGTPVIAQDNFRLLLSDDNSDKTAIDDFESVIVTVLGIGFSQSSGPEILINATNTEDFNSGPYDLKDYLGPDAVEIWEGHLEPGDYKKVVLYLADDISGTLTPEAGGGEVNVQLPSDKLKLNIPFTVGEGIESDTNIDYVFDITVFKAGDSGKYIVKPVIHESGPDQKYALHGKVNKNIVEGVEDVENVEGVEDVEDVEDVKDVENVEDVEEIEFDGTINSISPLVIGDYKVNIVGDTVIEGIEGDISKVHVGLTARVEGIHKGNNVVVASKIHIIVE